MKHLLCIITYQVMLIIVIYYDDDYESTCFDDVHISYVESNVIIGDNEDDDED